MCNILFFETQGQIEQTLTELTPCQIFVTVPSQDLDFQHYISWSFFVFIELSEGEG
jgi:hypothetical protein